jgi:hypothetical protein
VIDDAQAALAAYYAFTGDAAHMVEALLTTPAQIRAAVTQFADLGADEQQNNDGPGAVGTGTICRPREWGVGNLGQRNEPAR